MKKFTALLLSVLLVASLAACAGNDGNTGRTTAPRVTGAAVTTTPAEPRTTERVLDFPETQGFVIYEDMPAAVEAVGFDFVPPRRLSGFFYTDVQVHPEREIIQAVYIYSGDLYAIIRKAKTTEDISDDDSEYGIVELVEVGERQVTMKGDGELMHLATWTDGEFSYAIKHLDGVAKDTMSAIVRTVE